MDGVPEEGEGDSEPTSGELEERNAVLEAIVAARQRRITELDGLLADLERCLGRNPRDSSMPPSAEGFAKPRAPKAPSAGPPSASPASTPFPGLDHHESHTHRLQRRGRSRRLIDRDRHPSPTELGTSSGLGSDHLYASDVPPTGVSWAGLMALKRGA